MSTSKPSPPLPTAGCPACGAALKPGADRCWLCGDELPITAEMVEQNPFGPPAPGMNPWLLHGGIWLGIVLCGLILFGLMLGENKYYAIGFAIIAVPTILITLGGATLGRALGNPLHPAVKAAIGGAIAAVLLPVAFVVALFIACTEMCGVKW